MLKSYYVVVVIVLLILLGGCAHIKSEILLPDGTKITGEYLRLFNQKMESFTITDPNGWTLELLGQESDIKTAFRLGAMSVEIGK